LFVGAGDICGLDIATSDMGLPPQKSEVKA
jgi:hypothetical protein